LPPDFVQRLTGATILRLDRRAKYLLGRLDRDETLVMHLGMSGRFDISRAEGQTRPGQFHNAVAADAKHAHIVFETEAGNTVTYYDPRRFGYMALIGTATLDQHPWFAGLGPEPLSDAFDTARLLKVFAGRTQGPKTLLLDQRTVVGLGNIYVCEALNRARISPFKPAGQVSATRLSVLVPEIKAVLAEAIAAGGSTLRDFAQTDGALGYFQHSFRTYDREGERCRNDGCKGVIGREMQAGRSTFFCRWCQR
jgi:formamidopyrimidine-DNA glycosylase